MIIVSNSEIFNIIVKMVGHIAYSLFADFLDPESTQGLAILIYSPEYNINIVLKYFYVVSEIFITIGMVQLILYKKQLSESPEFYLFL